MQPDPVNLLEKMGISTPLIGFYDAPDVSPFEPIVTSKKRKYNCIFAYYKKWLNGETLHITEDNPSCPGASYHLFNKAVLSQENLIKFLVNGEGLKASQDLMKQWLDQQKTFNLEFPNILIGPLKEKQYKYLKSVTFYVNPDQASALMVGAQYHAAPDDPRPVIAPFGSGCMQMAKLFDDLNVPQAAIGATDIAMRSYIPPDIIAFTVTKPMFKMLCELDEKSFFYKPFWKNLIKAREKTS